MSKNIYIRAFSSQDQGKVLEVASKIQEKLGLPAKSFYFPDQNENGYWSVLVRCSENTSELEMRARIAWATR